MKAALSIIGFDSTATDREGTMNVHRSVVAVLAVATIVASIGAGAALTGGEPQGRKAVNVRSEALSVENGLGEHSRSTASETQPDWLRALRIRSEALNARYRLGEHARSAADSTTPVWLRALMLRSDALNRQYKLGKYTSTS